MDSGWILSGCRVDSEWILVRFLSGFWVDSKQLDPGGSWVDLTARSHFRGSVAAEAGTPSAPILGGLF